MNSRDISYYGSVTLHGANNLNHRRSEDSDPNMDLLNAVLQCAIEDYFLGREFIAKMFRGDIMSFYEFLNAGFGGNTILFSKWLFGNMEFISANQKARIKYTLLNYISAEKFIESIQFSKWYPLIKKRVALIDSSQRRPVSEKLIKLFKTKDALLTGKDVVVPIQNRINLICLMIEKYSRRKNPRLDTINKAIISASNKDRYYVMKVGGRKESIGAIVDLYFNSRKKQSA